MSPLHDRIFGLKGIVSTSASIRNLPFHLLSSPPLFWTHGIHLFLVHLATSTFLDDDRGDVALTKSFFPSLVLEVKSWFCSPYGSSTGNYLVDFLFFHHKRHSHDVRIWLGPFWNHPIHFFTTLLTSSCSEDEVQAFVTRMFFPVGRGENMSCASTSYSRSTRQTTPVSVPLFLPVTVPCGSMPLGPSHWNLDRGPFVFTPFVFVSSVTWILLFTRTTIVGILW